MTPDGVTIEVVSFLEQGEAMRVFVSIDPEGWLAADSTGISVFSFSGGLRMRLELVIQ